jgi:GT2 family glycosyltransferase
VKGRNSVVNDDRALTDEIVVSLVVPTHRGFHRLPTLLRALEAQDFDGAWEVLVVVDGVCDDTPELLNSFVERLPLRSLVMSQSAGVCRALNEGFTSARGRVLIRCDDDLTPRPSMVSLHVAHHVEPGLRGIIGPTRDVFPDTAYAQAYGRSANLNALSVAYTRPLEDRWLHWAAHNSLTREAWELVGGFDERFVYGQDSELGWRLARAGVALHIDAGLEIEHRGPTITATDRVPRAYVSGASRRLFRLVHPEVQFPTNKPSTLRGRLWSVGTAVFATMIRSRDGYRRLGRGVDRVLSTLPPSLARHVVAFAVETAGRSGAAHGPGDLAVFKGQKTAEVATELGQGLNRPGCDGGSQSWEG